MRSRPWEWRSPSTGAGPTSRASRTRPTRTSGSSSPASSTRRSSRWTRRGPKRPRRPALSWRQGQSPSSRTPWSSRWTTPSCSSSWTGGQDSSSSWAGSAIRPFVPAAWRAKPGRRGPRATRVPSREPLTGSSIRSTGDGLCATTGRWIAFGAEDGSRTRVVWAAGESTPTSAVGPDERMVRTWRRCCARCSPIAGP